jgi:thiol:disulfide interchange protein DsbC
MNPTSVLCAVITVLFVSFAPVSNAADDLEKVRAGLQKLVRDAPISSIRPTAIDGVYEVESLYDVFYYAPKAELLIIGEMYAKDSSSLTAQTKDAIITRTISALDLTKAVKTGSGKNSVIEFTDPDCPHCRNAFEYWQNVPDVTRYTFLFPIAESHPQAVGKSEWILSRKDKAAALNEVFAGKHDKSIPTGITEAGKNLLKEHIRNAEKAFVIGTPLYFVNGKLLPGVNVEAFEAALLPQQ